MSNKKSICMVIPYFGNLPNYFNLWLTSARYNKEIDFLIITDSNEEFLLPENVKIMKTSFDNLKTRIQALYPFKIRIRSPYKLCDFRPAYGEIFENELLGYDFWGYCDIDLIFGNVQKFVTNDILEKYDKINLHGHFSLYRNNKKMNELYKKKNKELVNYEFVFGEDWSYHFDEYPGISFICEYENIKTIDIENYADISWLDQKFIKKYDHSERLDDDESVKQVFFWKDGKLLDLIKVDNQVISEEYMYVHLQKRKMDNQVKNIEEGFYIVPNKFITMAYDDVVKRMDDYAENVNTKLLKSFKKECRRNRRKLSYWKMKIKMARKRWK